MGSFEGTAIPSMKLILSLGLDYVSNFLSMIGTDNFVGNFLIISFISFGNFVSNFLTSTGTTG